ncbi:MAG: VOC family protein [Proteobacteria bacterium]|nr:VOC family protein [Pseudomonadota bacterium]
MVLHEAVPILRIFSVEKAKEFYLDFLGFTLDWEHRFGDNFPLYAQVSRSEIVLHLSEHYGDATPGSAVLIHMNGIDAFHHDLVAQDYRYAKPGIEDAPWGARTVTLTDPFGNRLTFSESRNKE